MNPDVDNFDDLLNLTQDEVSSEKVTAKPAASRRKQAPKADPLADKIASLEAKLAEPDPVYEEDDEDPVIIEQQARIKELEDQLARKVTTQIENAPDRYQPSSGEGDLLLIHFEEDGFTVFGQSWYRGQELEIVLNGPEHQRTMDREGKSWLDLVDDRHAQISRWGRVMFERGPFVPRPGERFKDAVAEEDARRGRALPVIR